MKLPLLLAGLLGLASTARAQGPAAPAVPVPAATARPASHPAHGSLYASWSYNRDWYTKSDIRFRNSRSDNYDFTLYRAVAHDHPSMSDFWKPDNLTVPQYDLTVGYLFHDKHDLGIEVSWNHLKYVVDDNQVMRVAGQLRGYAFDHDTLVTPDFVHLQHTNGNNYLMVNLVKRRQLLAGHHLTLNAIGKVGGGPMITYTIASVFGSHSEGPFHYEGWVAGASLGLRLDIYRHFFLQTDMQGAYADYTDSYVGFDRQTHVTHHFGSAQWIYGFGYQLPL